jgi:hypothetical protein
MCRTLMGNPALIMIEGRPADLTASAAIRTEWLEV